MTAPRLSRGSRGRFFLYAACLLGFIGLMAIYHNTLTQLDAVKKSHEICTQQQESLTAQLQVIFDYKTRLEKSLQSEKAEHKQTRTELQKKAENEKTNCEKNTQESNLRFTSLQQQLSILESNHKDLQQDSIKVQKEKETLTVQLKEMATKLKEKEELFEGLKTKYMEILDQKTNLEKEFAKFERTQQSNETDMLRLMKDNGDLKREIKDLKRNCDKEVAIEIEKRYSVQSEHVGDQPSAAAAVPETPDESHPIDDTLNVLPQPNINPKKSTPKQVSSTKETPVKIIPPGVVPVPELEPNRYRNSILELDDRKPVDDRKQLDDRKPLKKPNVDQENGAMEVLDSPNLKNGGGEYNGEVAKKHIDSLGKVPRQMPGGLRLGPMHYDGGDYEKQEEKGGDLQLEEAAEQEGEEDDADDDYNGHLDPRQKEPAVRN